jgi:hypothetical protein
MERGLTENFSAGISAEQRNASLQYFADTATLQRFKNLRNGYGITG